MNDRIEVYLEVTMDQIIGLREAYRKGNMVAVYGSEAAALAKAKQIYQASVLPGTIGFGSATSLNDYLAMAIFNVANWRRASRTGRLALIFGSKEAIEDAAYALYLSTLLFPPAPPKEEEIDG